MSRTPSQRGRYAKQRGSSFELDISHQLFDELGIHFRRNLEQVRLPGSVTSCPTQMTSRLAWS